MVLATVLLLTLVSLAALWSMLAHPHDRPALTEPVPVAALAHDVPIVTFDPTGMT